MHWFRTLLVFRIENSLLPVTMIVLFAHLPSKFLLSTFAFGCVFILFLYLFALYKYTHSIWDNSRTCKYFEIPFPSFFFSLHFNFILHWEQRYFAFFYFAFNSNSYSTCLLNHSEYSSWAADTVFVVVVALLLLVSTVEFGPNITFLVLSLQWIYCALKCCCMTILSLSWKETKKKRNTEIVKYHVNGDHQLEVHENFVRSNNANCISQGTH